MDRRRSSRVLINVKSVIYIKNKNEEISGMIHDISDEGIAIIVNNKDIDGYIINNDIKIVFLDEYIVFGEERRKLISITAYVVREVDLENNKKLIGCTISNKDLENIHDYVVDKRVAVYLRILDKA